jgi:hypothetical protein
MSKFPGKTTIYGYRDDSIELKQESSIDPEKEVVNYEAEYEVIQKTVGNLLDEISNTMNTDTPFFVFNVKRRNEKIRLNNEAQVMMFNQIQNVRAISNELLNLEADKIYGPKLLKYLVDMKLLDAEHCFEEIIAAHKLSITKKEVDKTLTISLIDHDSLDKQKKLSEIKLNDGEARILNANADKTGAEADLIKARVNSINKFNESFDPSKLSDELKVKIFISSVAPGVEYTDPNIEKSLNDSFSKSEKAKANILEHQATEQEIKVDELRERKKMNDKKRGKL